MLSLGPFVSYLTINIFYTVVVVAGMVATISLPESPHFLYMRGMFIREILACVEE
jgi:hypothetical protein